MAAARLPMKRIKYILSLHYDEGYSVRRIARQVGVNRSTVSRTLARFQAVQQPWAQCQDLSQEELMQLLYGSDRVARSSKRPLPDWETIHKSLAQHSYMTLRVLWLEYQSEHADALAYSQFCNLYRNWRRRSHDRVDMRQTRIAGERLEMDYSGKRPLITDPHTGEQHPVELFVAVLAYRTTSLQKPREPNSSKRSAHPMDRAAKAMPANPPAKRGRMAEQPRKTVSHRVESAHGAIRHDHVESLETIAGAGIPRTWGGCTSPDAYEFALEFKYPTDEERDRLRIIHRDMSKDQLSHINSHKQSLRRLVKDLNAGKVDITDLDPEDVRALKHHSQSTP